MKENDCISRKQTIERLKLNFPISQGADNSRDRHRYMQAMADLQAIREMPSVAPQEPRWIPMVRREPTDEEKAEYLAQNGEEICYMLENEMPVNGQEVLVSIGEFVSEDVFDEDFYNFENNDIENVDAWMPLPKPYKGEIEPQESEVNNG